MAIDRITPAMVSGEVDDDVARSWLTCVHASLREDSADARVLSTLKPPGPGWNYYSVVVGSPAGEQLRMLLNAGGRLVAASNDGGVPAIGPLDFVNVPHPQPFADAGFVVESAEDLLAPLADEHLASLSDSDLADVDYHRPGRVGDLLFNWFD
jgi:hypothetical protein